MDTTPEAQADRLNEAIHTYGGGGRALAKAIGVSEQTVSKWRQGRTRLSWERATQVAMETSYDPGWLYAGIDGWVPPGFTSFADMDLPEPIPGAPPPSRLDELAERLDRVEALLRRHGLDENGPAGQVGDGGE